MLMPIQRSFERRNYVTKVYLEERRWKDNEDEEQKLPKEEWLAPFSKLLGISNIFKQLLQKHAR